MKWNCFIPGKPDTDWEGGFYPLAMEFSEDYPTKPPKVRPAAQPPTCRGCGSRGWHAPLHAASAAPRPRHARLGRAASGTQRRRPPARPPANPCPPPHARPARSASSPRASSTPTSTPLAPSASASSTRWGPGPGRGRACNGPCMRRLQGLRPAGAPPLGGGGGCIHPFYASLSAYLSPQDEGWKPSITVKQILLGVQVRRRAVAARKGAAHAIGPGLRCEPLAPGPACAAPQCPASPPSPQHTPGNLHTSHPSIHPLTHPPAPGAAGQPQRQQPRAERRVCDLHAAAQRVPEEGAAPGHQVPAALLDRPRCEAALTGRAPRPPS